MYTTGKQKYNTDICVQLAHKENNTAIFTTRTQQISDVYNWSTTNNANMCTNDINCQCNIDMKTAHKVHINTTICEQLITN